MKCRDKTNRLKADSRRQHYNGLRWIEDRQLQYGRVVHYWPKDPQHHQTVSLTEETNVLWYLPVKLINRDQ